MDLPLSDTPGRHHFVKDGPHMWTNGLTTGTEVIGVLRSEFTQFGITGDGKLGEELDRQTGVVRDMDKAGY